MMIEKTFAFHKPSAASLEKITQLSAAYTALKRGVEEIAPASRERSVALTELETSAMWAIKSVVSNDPASEAETR